MTGAGAGNVAGGFSFTAVANLQGGAGSDTLNYSSYPGAVTVNLQAASATGLASFSGFESIIGSPSNADTIIGRDTGSIFNLTARTAAAWMGWLSAPSNA